MRTRPAKFANKAPTMAIIRPNLAYNTTMAHTIKISGVSDELLRRVDERWKGRHYADRSEYVRDLIRKDVLGEQENATPNFSAGIRSLFRELHDKANREGWTDEAISENINVALAEVRQAKKRAV